MIHDIQRGVVFTASGAYQPPRQVTARGTWRRVSRFLPPRSWAAVAVIAVLVIGTCMAFV